MPASVIVLELIKDIDATVTSKAAEMLLSQLMTKMSAGGSQIYVYGVFKTNGEVVQPSMMELVCQNVCIKWLRYVSLHYFFILCIVCCAIFFNKKIIQ